MTTNGAPQAAVAPPAAAVAVKRLPPRITPVSDYSTLSMDRHSVAAHPWHDLEIGKRDLSSHCVAALPCGWNLRVTTICNPSFWIPAAQFILFPRIAEFAALKLHDLFLQDPKHQQFSTV
jgi:hypothetical protein